MLWGAISVQLVPFSIALLGVALLLTVLLYATDRKMLVEAGLLPKRARIGRVGRPSAPIEPIRIPG